MSAPEVAPVAPPTLQEVFTRLYQEGWVTACEGPLDIPSDDMLNQLALQERPHLPRPDQMPALHGPTVAWAATFLCRTAMAYLHREWEAPKLAALLACNPPNGASLDSFAFSADLALRHLPLLAKQARAAHAEDPLLLHLEAVAARFPLSGVGLATPEPDALAAVLNQPCLRLMYLDRLLPAPDPANLAATLALPPVQNALRAALGDHPHLASAAVRDVLSSRERVPA